MARIVEHLAIEGLEARHRAAQDATEAQHVQAIWLLAHGRDVLDVAAVLAFVPRLVEEVAPRRDAHGPDDITKARLIAEAAKEVSQPDTPRAAGHPGRGDLLPREEAANP